MKESPRGSQDFKQVTNKKQNSQTLKFGTQTPCLINLNINILTQI